MVAYLLVAQASLSTIFGLRGPYADAMATNLLSNISHYTGYFFPLVAPLLPVAATAAVFNQISLTTHEYLYHATFRFRVVWNNVLAMYWPPGVGTEALDARRQEDLMLAITAFLLQRVCRPFFLLKKGV